MDKIKILIIDDDQVDRINCRRMLEKNVDFLATVIEADNAKQGIQLAEKENVDCVLLDYLLPDIDGIHVARVIRDNSGESALAIIMLTGQGSEHIAVTAMKEGVDDYLVKGELSSRALITTIQNTLNRLELKKQLKLNRELEEKNKIATEEYDLKNEFLRNMSHELRTPLAEMIGLTSLFCEGEFGSINHEQTSVLNNILASAKHLLQLITNAIDITDIDTRQIKFFPEEIDLTNCITEIVDLFKSLVLSKNINLTIHIETNFPRVFIDPARFKQVLTHYLSNAIKFTPKSGVVRIAVKLESNTTFRLEVKDNGIGISADDINKLFNTFQQLDSSTAKKYEGAGLGLALVKRIVHMQGGEVGVKSIPGKETVFYAILPLRVTI